MDVYEGVQIDENGRLVTFEIFLVRLTGNKTAVAGKESAGVLSPNPLIMYSYYSLTTEPWPDCIS